MIDKIIESKEFKDFVKLVEKYSGRTVNSCSIGPGYIEVDGWRYCIPGLGSKDILYKPLYL